MCVFVQNEVSCNACSVSTSVNIGECSRLFKQSFDVFGVVLNSKVH